MAAYCRRTGRQAIENWNFYVAFALFRLAAIAQGVFRRGRDGIGTGHSGGETNAAPQIAAYGLALVKDAGAEHILNTEINRQGELK